MAASSPPTCGRALRASPWSRRTRRPRPDHVRGRRLLAAADVVIADRLGPRDLLDEVPPHVEVIDAAKIPYGRYMAQEAINAALIEHAKQGKAVVRLKGGDPYVFGRGMEEAQALAEAGIACTVVPGISSSISVPSAAGIPVTHRGVAHEFTVVSGHVAPDDERSLVGWESLAKLRGTLVILMGVDKIGKIAQALIAHGKAADTPLALIQEGTTAAQRRVDATLATVAEAVRTHEVKPPAVPSSSATSYEWARSPWPSGPPAPDTTRVTSGNGTRPRPLAPHPGQGSITLWLISSPSTTPTTPACATTRA